MKYLLILLIQLFSAIILFAQYNLESSTESIGGGLQSSSTLFLYSNFGQFSGGQSQNSNFKLNDGFIYYLTEYTLLAEEPSNHSNQFAVDSVLSAASIRFAIQPAEQIGALGYIVLAKEGGKPNIFMDDGSDYQLYATQSNSKIVAKSYDKSSNNITATGLQPSKSYTFVLIPFNWDGSQNSTINYKTDEPAPTVTQATPIPTMTEWALIILGIAIPLIVYFRINKHG